MLFPLAVLQTYWMLRREFPRLKLGFRSLESVKLPCWQLRVNIFIIWAVLNLDGIINLLPFPLFPWWFLITPLPSPYFTHISRPMNVKCFEETDALPWISSSLVPLRVKYLWSKDKDIGTVLLSLKAFSHAPLDPFLIIVLRIGQNGCFCNGRAKVQWTWPVTWPKCNSFWSSHHTQLNMAFALSPLYFHSQPFHANETCLCLPTDNL